jgi:hypothetical protein
MHLWPLTEFTEWRYIDLKFFVSITLSMWPLGVKKEGSSGTQKTLPQLSYIFLFH